MSELHLHTVLEPRGPAAAIVLTDEEVAVLGPAKNPAVVVSFGDRSARLRLARMGGENMIGFSKAARAELGLEIGQQVEVTIQVDATERTVEVPPALADALAADPALKERFDALSYTTRKEHARAIAEAKQDATRERRLAKILDSLRG